MPETPGNKLEIIRTDEDTATPPGRIPERKERRIRTTKDARRMLSKLISEFRNGKIDGANARTACYLLSTYVQITTTVDLEDRIARLEKHRPA